MHSVLAVLVSAALMWAAFPPVNAGCVVFLAPAPFLWALRRVRSKREAAGLGFLFGFAFFGGMLWWIYIIGAVAWIPLITALGVYAALYALVLYVARHWSPWRWWVVAVGGWAAWEFVRARFPLGGFPWGSAGYPVGTIPGARSAAQWIGPTGWGVIVIAFAAALVLMTEEERDRRPLELTTGLLALLVVAGFIFSPDATGAEVDAVIVQGNSPCPGVHCADEKEQIYNSHYALTRQIPADGVDLIVWGEDSFGGSFNPTFNPEVASQMGSEAERLGSYLLAGGTRSAGPENFDNVNVLFSPEGAIAGEYMKQHPVPYGEYVPFRDQLGFIQELQQVPRDMRRGEGPVVFDLHVGGQEVRLGSVISFEGAFIRHMRAEVRRGANLLVVATNEGSYGRSPASEQLISMVRLNAVSLGVDVVHAAVTGRSTFISADGSIATPTDLFTSAVMRGSVRVQESRRTFYAIVGDWLQISAMVAALVVLVIGFWPARGFKIRLGARR
jgi:apolipoprotein N-acyltransferase